MCLPPCWFFVDAKFDDREFEEIPIKRRTKRITNRKRYKMTEVSVHIRAYPKLFELKLTAPHSTSPN